MPLNAATLAHKYRMLPDQQTVTLARNGSTIATVAGAVRRPINKAQAAVLGGIGSEVETTSFLLPNVNLSSQTPTAGDTITDASSVPWAIQHVSRELAGTVHRCACARGR